MDIVFLPLLLLIVAMFIMTRSAKKKQQQVATMRDQVQPGTGVRTIGGLYARVKEVGEDTVLLELAPGVHSYFTKNAIGAVLEDDEYDAIINPQAPSLGADDAVVPDDASSLTETDDKPNLVKDVDADRDSAGVDDAPKEADQKDTKDDDSEGSTKADSFKKDGDEDSK